MITQLRSAAIVAAVAAALGAAAAAPQTADRASWTLASRSVAQTYTAPSPEWGFDSDSGPDDGRPCPFTASPGYLYGGGGDSEVIQDNGHAYMGCGGGPTISLDHIDGDTVTFSLHGDRIRVSEGSTDRLGPYQVHVIRVSGQRVELELSNPD